MLINSFNNIRALEKLDAAGVEVFGNARRGFFWADRAAVDRLKMTTDLAKTKLHGPFPTYWKATHAAAGALQ